jgi:ankyrin repeat protein
LSVFYRHAEVTAALLAVHPLLDVFEAATLGQVDRLRQLLVADRAQVAGFTSQGFTPLGLAAFMGHTEAVKFLLEHGAPIDTVDRSFNANTALDAAVAGNHTETALLLLERGASVHARDGAQHTPLHKAAHHANVTLIQALLQRAADVAARNKDGKTAADLVPSGHAEASRLVALPA